MKTLKLLAPELNDNQLKMIERELLGLLKLDGLVDIMIFGWPCTMCGFDPTKLEEVIREFIGVE